MQAESAMAQAAVTLAEMAIMMVTMEAGMMTAPTMEMAEIRATAVNKRLM
jgi:hypothetical protein